MWALWSCCGNKRLDQMIVTFVLIYILWDKSGGVCLSKIPKKRTKPLIIDPANKCYLCRQSHSLFLCAIELCQNVCAPTLNMPERLSFLISVTRPSKPSIFSMATRIKGQFPATSLTFKCPFVTFFCCQHLISVGEKEPNVCLGLFADWKRHEPPHAMLDLNAKKLQWLQWSTQYWAGLHQITWSLLFINISRCIVCLKPLLVCSVCLQAVQLKSTCHAVLVLVQPFQ